jgi:acetyl-CoA acetyltransferase
MGRNVFIVAAGRSAIGEFGGVFRSLARLISSHR